MRDRDGAACCPSVLHQPARPAVNAASAASARRRTHTGLPQFFQPGGTMARGIDLLAGARNRPTPIYRLETIHHEGKAVLSWPLRPSGRGWQSVPSADRRTPALPVPGLAAQPAGPLSGTYPARAESFISRARSFLRIRQRTVAYPGPGGVSRPSIRIQDLWSTPRRPFDTDLDPNSLVGCGSARPSSWYGESIARSPWLPPPSSRAYTQGVLLVP
jgi:hypothetical protein